MTAPVALAGKVGVAFVGENTTLIVQEAFGASVAPHVPPRLPAARANGAVTEIVPPDNVPVPELDTVSCCEALEVPTF